MLALFYQFFTIRTLNFTSKHINHSNAMIPGQVFPIELKVFLQLLQFHFKSRYPRRQMDSFAFLYLQGCICQFWIVSSASLNRSKYPGPHQNHGDPLNAVLMVSMLLNVSILFWTNSPTCNLASSIDCTEIR